ncbi:hypothetical protein [Halosimplex marinum]|uniref:hypothetical protein n=1 Tax=Halosimplex marinum TaxID=3396620 RepID=UPI003F562ABD
MSGSLKEVTLFGTLAAGLFHSAVTVFIIRYFDYDFDTESLTRGSQVWIALGSFFLGSVPMYLYLTYGTISPILVVTSCWFLVVRTEIRRGPGEPFGTLYLGLWPIVVALSIGAFWLEYILIS